MPRGVIGNQSRNQHPMADGCAVVCFLANNFSGLVCRLSDDAGKGTARGALGERFPGRHPTLRSSAFGSAAACRALQCLLSDEHGIFLFLFLAVQLPQDPLPPPEPKTHLSPPCPSAEEKLLLDRRRGDCTGCFGRQCAAAALTLHQFLTTPPPRRHTLSLQQPYWAVTAPAHALGVRCRHGPRHFARVN